MSVVDIGTICVKKRGREKGRKCVVIDIIDKNFALISGPQNISGVRRRRVNVTHLSPTADKLNLKKGSSDKVILAALKKSGKEDIMRQ